MQPRAKEYLDILPRVIRTDENQEGISEENPINEATETIAISDKAYTARFTWEFWIRLLEVVSDFIGPGFYP